MAKILVAAVDDEPEVLKLYRLIISREPDMEFVASGTSGRDALQLARRAHPDVLIMDVQMPDLPGIDAAERIAQGLPSIGIILVTGHETLDVVKRALRVGVSEFLVKPVTPNDLLAAVRAAAISRNRGATESGMARTWAFLGSKGTSGTTTLAVNVACALARKRAATVLVDADLFQGDCAFQLDLSPSGKSLHELLAGHETLDRTLVASQERCWRSPIDGCELQVIESRGEYLELGPPATERFKTVLDQLAMRYQHVLVDLAPAQLLEPLPAVAADVCDDLVCVTNEDLPALKALATQLRLLRESGFSMEKITVLINGLVTQSDVDPVEWVAERFHGMRSIRTLPVDRDRCNHALAAGVPLVLQHPAHPLAKLIEGLIAGEAAPVAARRPSTWAARLWKTFAQKVRHLVHE